MTLEDAKKLIIFCEERGIKSVAFEQFAVEFFPKEPEAMNLDPVALSKALTDSMPDDSAMLFASSEDMNVVHSPQEESKADMN